MSGAGRVVWGVEVAFLAIGVCALGYVAHAVVDLERPAMSCWRRTGTRGSGRSGTSA